MVTFYSFVTEHGGFSGEEVEHLQSVIIKRKLLKLMYVCSILAAWSMLAAWIDVVLMPAILVYVVAKPDAMNYPLIIFGTWTVINGLLKFIFIRRKVGDVVSLLDSVIAIVPYAGAVYLMKSWFIGDPLLKRASLDYVKYRKSTLVEKVYCFFKRQKRSEARAVK